MIFLSSNPEKETRGLSASGATIVRGFELFGEEVRFKGRDDELSALQKIWSGVLTEGHGHAVLVSGSEGLGKTRLVHEFSKRVAQKKEVRVLCMSASVDSIHSSSGLAGQVLRARFDLPSASSVDLAQTRLRGALGQILSARQLGDGVQLLGHLLGIPAGDVSERAKALMWDRGLASLVSLIRRDIKKNPHLVVVDGIDEADVRDRALLKALASAAAGSRLMLILIARRKSAFPEASYDAETAIELSPLDEAASSSLAEAMLSRMSEAPEQLVQALVQRAKGNPRMMEQVLRALVSKGIVDISSSPWDFRPDKLAKAFSPTSAEDAARDRIEALDPALRDILSKAAIVGTTFWFSAVLAILRVEKEDGEAFWVDDRKRNRLSRVMLDLIALDLVRQSSRSTVEGDQEYSFNNEHEVQFLLDSQPGEVCALNHGLIAQWMRRAALKVDDGYEWSLATAKHEAAAGHASEAARDLLVAARKAHERLRNSDAREHLCEAAAMLRADEGELRYDVHMLLGDVDLVMVDSQAASESFQAALHDSVVLDDKDRGAGAYIGLGRAYALADDYGHTAEMMRRARALYQEVDNGAGVALALDELGNAIWRKRGDESYTEALSCFMKALTIRRKLSDKSMLAGSLKNLARIHLGNGYASHARKYAKEALSIHKEEGAQKDLVDSLILLGSTWFEAQDYRRGLDIWSRASVVAEETGDRSALGLVLSHMGEAYLKLEDYTTARVYLREAQQLARDVGDFSVIVEAMRNESIGLLLKGDIKGALACIEEAVGLAEEKELAFKRALCWATRARVWGEALVAGVLEETAEAHRRVSDGFSRAELGLTNMGAELTRGRVLEDYAAYLRANGSDRADAVTKKAAEILSRRKKESPVSPEK